MTELRRDIRVRYMGQDSTGSATRSVRRNVDSIGSSYNSLQRKIATTNQLIAGITLGAGGTNAIATLADLQGNTARLSAVTKTLAKDNLFLANSASRLSLDIEAATKSFARLKVLQDAQALGAGEPEKLLIGLGDAFARFGANAGQQENVLYGLAQALGQGTLQAQELNQVVEPLPGLLNDIAKQAGLTAGEYRALIKEGGYLSTTFKRDIVGALNSYAGAAEKLSGNIRQTLTRLSNDYKNFLIQFNTPITGGIANIADALGGALRLAGDNAAAIASSVGVAAQAIALAFGVKAVKGIREFTTSFVSSTKQRIEAAKSEREAYAQKAARDKAILAESRRTAAAQLVQTKRQQRAENFAEQRAERSRAADLRVAAAKKRELVEDREKSVVQAKLQEDQAKSNLRDVAVRKSKNALLVEERKILLQSADSDSKREKATLALNAANKKLETSKRGIISQTIAAQRAEDKATKSRALLASATAKLAKAEAAVASSKTKSTALSARDATLAIAANAAAAKQVTSQRNLLLAAEGVSAAVQKQTLAFRVQQGVAASLSLGLRGLSSVYALLGGGAGVALLAVAGIAKLTYEWRKQDPVITTAKEKVKALSQEFENMRIGIKGSNDELSELDSLTVYINEQEKLAEKIRDSRVAHEKLREELRAGGGVSARDLPFSDQFGSGIREGKAEANAEEARNTKEQLENLKRRKALADNIIANENALASSFADYTDKVRSDAQAMLGDYETQAQKIEKVKKKMAVLDKALSLPSLRSSERKEIIAARKEIEKERDEITGAKEAREELIQTIKDQRKEQQRIIEGVDSEVEAIRRKYKNERLTLNVSLNTTDLQGNALIDQSTYSGVLARIAKQEQEEITAIEEREASRRQRAREQATQSQMEGIRAEAAARKSLQSQLDSATALVDPLKAIRDQSKARIDEINIRSKFEIGIQKNQALLLKAEKIRLAQETEAAITQIEAKAVAARAKAYNVARIDAASNTANSFLELARPQYDQYIEIQSSMTRAEKQFAERSNSINEKRFKKDKKLRIAQAIVDTYAGANRAIATGGFTGISQALAVIAFGLKNVRNIQSEKFSGTGGVSAAANGGSGYSDDQVSRANRRSDVQTQAGNVVVLVAPGTNPQDAVRTANEFLPMINKAAQTEQIKIKDNRISVSDVRYLSVGG